MKGVRICKERYESLKGVTSKTFVGRFDKVERKRCGDELNHDYCRVPNTSPSGKYRVSVRSDQPHASNI